MCRQKLSPIGIIIFDRRNQPRRCPFPGLLETSFVIHNDYDPASATDWDRKKSEGPILLSPPGDYRQDWAGQGPPPDALVTSSFSDLSANSCPSRLSCAADLILVASRFRLSVRLFCNIEE